MMDANDRRRAGLPALTETREIEPPPSEPAAAPKAGARKLSEVLGEAFDRMDARASGEERPLETPWADFNEQLPGGGFWPGCHVLVSGTGAGKSTWALQLALHAARNDTAVIYAGLELEDTQIALRLAGEAAKVGWSKLYTGEANDLEREKARRAYGELESLPFYLEAGDPMGWCAARMQSAAEEIRQEHPDKGLLIVVDFLQLIGSDPASPARQDLRERIGRAAYVARDVAKRMKATVLLISSVAREHYLKLSNGDALREAGLDAELSGASVVERFMKAPDSIVGMGKESGEIEYAADTVTIAISLPRDREAQARSVVFATAKMRAGRPSWCSLDFDGLRFSDDLGHGKKVVDWMRKPKEERPKPPQSKSEPRTAPRGPRAD